MVIFPIIILIFITLFIRFFSGTWAAPGAIFAGYWSVAIILALILAPDGYPVTAMSIWWICASVLCLGVGSILSGVSKPPIKDSRLDPTINKFKSLKKAVVFFSILGTGGVFYLMKSLGFGIGIFFSFDTLKMIGASVSEARYLDNYAPPSFYNLMLCFTYAACYLGGMLGTLQKTKIAYLPFLPIVLSLVIMNTKAGILFAVFLWFAGWLSMRVRLGRLKFSFSFVLRLILLVTTLTSVFFVTSMIRYKTEGLSNFVLIYEKLTVYYIGFLSAFSQWLDMNYFQINDYGFGSYTLSGVFDFLGIQTRSQGIFNNVVNVGDYSTNIFTLFRYLIQDFGMPGSLIFLFFIGFSAGRMFEFTKNGSILAMPLLAMFYAQVFFSNTTTIFGYNTIILGSFIAFCYIGIHIFKLKRFSLTNSSKKRRKRFKFKKYRITW